MKKITSILVATICTIQISFAQDTVPVKGYKYNNYFDVAISGANDQFSGALSWSHLYGVGKGKKRFKVGYGLRLTSFVGANQYYTTAPSKFTSTEQGLGTLFSETIDGNIDTLSFKTSQVNALNISLHLQYTIKKKFDVGFNIDAIGFSFGGKKQGNVLSSSYDANQAPVVEAKPTAFNLLLTSDNDKGSLNSEFYVRYWLSNQFAIRTGYTYLFTEYTTTQNLSFNNGAVQNDRYRLKSGLFMLAVTWRPFN